MLCCCARLNRISSGNKMAATLTPATTTSLAFTRSVLCGISTAPVAPGRDSRMARVHLAWVSAYLYSSAPVILVSTCGSLGLQGSQGGDVRVGHQPPGSCYQNAPNLSPVTAECGAHLISPPISHHVSLSASTRRRDRTYGRGDRLIPSVTHVPTSRCMGEKASGDDRLSRQDVPDAPQG